VKIPGYDWKLAELGWFVVVALLTAVAQAAVEFDAATIAEWDTWAIAMGSGLVRAAGGAVLAFLAKRATS
jgi:hypothetical protein